MSLAERQKSFWQENGYLVVDDLLSPAEVEELRRRSDALVEPAKGITESTDRFHLKVGATHGALIQRVAEPHELGGEWMNLAKHPRLLDVIEPLLGPNIQLYYSMLMLKPPRQGFTSLWHQDFSFFPHNRADLLTCQVYIDDSTTENGCVRVVPGSHKLGLLNHFKDGAFSGVIQGDTSGFDEQEAVLEVRAGGMALWHSFTLHSSHANRSERPRRAIIFAYKNPEAHLLSGSFNSRMEVRTVGVMVRGRHPTGDLLSAV
jgi:phytanoyl-CoA hydroxylase